MCHACFSAVHQPAELPQVVQAICCRHCSAREVPGSWELQDSPADAAGAAPERPQGGGAQIRAAERMPPTRL